MCCILLSFPSSSQIVAEKTLLLNSLYNRTISNVSGTHLDRLVDDTYKVIGKSRAYLASQPSHKAYPWVTGVPNPECNAMKWSYFLLQFYQTIDPWPARTPGPCWGSTPGCCWRCRPCPGCPHWRTEACSPPGSVSTCCPLFWSPQTCWWRSPDRGYNKDAFLTDNSTFTFYSILVMYHADWSLTPMDSLKTNIVLFFWLKGKPPKETFKSKSKGSLKKLRKYWHWSYSFRPPPPSNGRDKKYRDICVKIFIPTPLPGLNNFDDFILVKFFNYPKKKSSKGRSKRN